MARGRKKQVIAQRRRGAKRMTENEIGKIVVDAAIAVHRALGPGLLETVYEIVLETYLIALSISSGTRMDLTFILFSP